MFFTVFQRPFSPDPVLLLIFSIFPCSIGIRWNTSGTRYKTWRVCFLRKQGSPVLIVERQAWGRSALAKLQKKEKGSYVLVKRMQKGWTRSELFVAQQWPGGQWPEGLAWVSSWFVPQLCPPDLFPNSGQGGGQWPERLAWSPSWLVKGFQKAFHKLYILARPFEGL